MAVTSRAKRAALLKLPRMRCNRYDFRLVTSRAKCAALIETPGLRLSVEVFRGVLQGLAGCGLVKETFDFLHCLR